MDVFWTFFFGPSTDWVGTLSASLLGNLLTGRGVNKKGKGIIRAGEGIVRACYGNKKKKAKKQENKFLMAPHPLTNFEIQKYKNESKFNGAYLEII